MERNMPANILFPEDICSIFIWMPNASRFLQQVVNAAHHQVPQIAEHSVRFWLEDKDWQQFAAMRSHLHQLLLARLNSAMDG